MILYRPHRILTSSRRLRGSRRRSLDELRAGPKSGIHGITRSMLGGDLSSHNTADVACVNSFHERIRGILFHDVHLIDANDVNSNNAASLGLGEHVNRLQGWQWHRILSCRHISAFDPLSLPTRTRVLHSWGTYQARLLVCFELGP